MNGCKRKPYRNERYRDGPLEALQTPFLIDDRPALILVPATLTQQSQVELWDRLSVPSARWLFAEKVWFDHLGHIIRANGAADILKCPYRVAVVSTAIALGNPDSKQEEVLQEALEGDEAEGLLVSMTQASTNELEALGRLTRLLDAAFREEDDPKYAVVQHYLRDRDWVRLGCIVFSQYFDTAQWIAERLASHLPDEPIALYAGAGKSGVYRGGRFSRLRKIGRISSISEVSRRFRPRAAPRLQPFSAILKG